MMFWLTALSLILNVASSRMLYALCQRPVWEYMSCILPMETHNERLDELGEQGWELCSCTEHDNSNRAMLVKNPETYYQWLNCYLKRRA